MDYYVSETGNDESSGTTIHKAWRNIGRVNQADLKAGDRVLFESGATFRGTLRLSAQNAGTASQPVVIGSYGSGRATILAPANAAGISVHNAGGIRVHDLIVQGPGKNLSNGTGVHFHTNLSNGARVHFVRIHNVEASGFRNGIQVASWRSDTGYDDVCITNSVAHDNLHAGIITYAQNSIVHSRIYIGNCRAYNNTGDPHSKGNTGNGIVVGNADGATIEHCTAYNNGRDNKPTEGPVGIWAYSSTNVVIQFNESHGNQTSNGDGGGFDLDIDVTNSLMQHNYSHGNAGAGFLLWKAGDGNVVRYNISENDGRSNNHAAAGITVGGEGSGASIYGNIVLMSPTSSGETPPAVKVMAGLVSAIFRNNLFVTTENCELARVERGATKVTEFWNNVHLSSPFNPCLEPRSSTRNAGH